MTGRVEDAVHSVGAPGIGLGNAGAIEGVAAGVQTRAGDEHSRARHGAALDQVPHGNVGIVDRSEVPHRRDTRLERPPGILLRQKDQDRGRDGLQTAPGVRARRAIPIERHVGVGVDQTRKPDQGPEVDDPGAGRNEAISPADGLDRLPFDQHDGIGNRLAPHRKEAGKPDRRHLPHQGRRRREAQQGDEHSFLQRYHGTFSRKRSIRFQRRPASRRRVQEDNASSKFPTRHRKPGRAVVNLDGAS